MIFDKCENCKHYKPDIKFCPNCGQELDWEDKKENVRNQEVE